MTRDDRSLDTQTAAPAVVPPKRPNVTAAMADDDRPARLEAQRQLLLALQESCDAIRIQHQAAMAKWATHN